MNPVGRDAMDLLTQNPIHPSEVWKEQCEWESIARAEVSYCSVQLLRNVIRCLFLKIFTVESLTWHFKC